ncbi:MAG: MFS transporter, partial [Clostridia bacterium]|nr:MFS transporter [Clostridia bacterium]
MKLIDQYRGLRREIYILFFGRMVTNLGSMVWPVMTLILSQKMGVSEKGVSVLLAAAMVGMAP